MSEKKVFYRKLWTLMLPISLQSLMLAAVAAADAVMLGRLDQNSMSAVSLATQIQFVQNIVVSSAVNAVMILGSQYWGKGEEDKVNDILIIGLRISILASLITWAGCIFTPEVLMSVFTNEPELIRIGASYLRIAGWSYLMTGISQSYLTIMKMTDHAGTTATISTVTVILNIVLNAVFIFGLLGVAPFGADGAAIATLIARTIELAWAVAVSFRSGYIRPNLSRFFFRDPVLGKDFRKVLLPLMGAFLLWGVGFTSYTAILGHMGTDAAAANSVSAVVRDIMCCLCNGIGSAGGIMVANELGAGNLDTGKEYGIRLARISVLLGIGTMLIVFSVILPVSRFMILTDQARTLLIRMMIIMGVYMIGRCINTVVINGVFDSGGDTLFDMYSLAVMMWCVAIPLAFCGAFFWNWSPVAVYACTCLDEVGKLPWVYVHFKKYKWVKDLTR